MKNMTERKRENLKFIWRITAAHVIAYFFAGLFATSLFDYESWFSSGILSSVMKPTTDPIVPIGFDCFNGHCRIFSCFGYNTNIINRLLLDIAIL